LKLQLKEIKKLAQAITIDFDARINGDYGLGKRSKKNGCVRRYVRCTSAFATTTHPFVTTKKIDAGFFAAEFKNGFLYTHNKLDRMDERIEEIIDELLCSGFGYTKRAAN